MMRKIGMLLIICLITTMFTSCYDANEADNLVHVIAIGIDRGVSDIWRLTILFPTLKESSGGSSSGSVKSGGADESGYVTLTVDSPSFFTGIDMLNASLSRRVNFMHAEVLVISEDLAESGALGEFLAPIIRYREIRRSLHVYVTIGSAEDYLEINRPIVGSALSKNMAIIQNQAGMTGFFPHVTLNNFYDQLKSTYDQPIAILTGIAKTENFKKEGAKWGDEFKPEGEYYAGELPMSMQNRTELFGSAVFDGDKMVGMLTGEETRLMQISNGEFKKGYFTMQDPMEPSLIVPISVCLAKKPKVNIKFLKGKPIINLKVELKGEILAVQSRINYEKPELSAVLEKAFEKQIKEGLDKLMQKGIGLKTDIFGFGRIAVRQFLTIQEWEKYNWIKQFQYSEINTEVKFTVIRSGTQLRSSPIISTEGKK